MFWQDLWDEIASWTVGSDLVFLARVSVAALLVYLVALLVARVGDKRFFGRNTVFDLLLALIIGGVLGRAINGGAALIPTAAAGLVLIGAHWIFGSLALRSNRFGRLIKGKGHQVVGNGRMFEQEMKRHSITVRDIEEAARLSGHSMQDVDTAYFERNGKISIQPKPREYQGTIVVDGEPRQIRLVEYRSRP